MLLAALDNEQAALRIPARNYDKRYFPRWEANKHVEYSEDGKMVLWSYMKDLSLDGAAIVMLGNLPSADRIKLKIHLGEKDVLETHGRIAWTKQKPDYQLVGIAFDGIDNESIEMILRHAFELNDDQLMIYG